MTNLTPKTCTEIEAEFRAELAALLARYNDPKTRLNDATLEADDHYRGYPECGEDVRMTVEIPGIYDGEGNCLRPWTTINLGRSFP